MKDAELFLGCSKWGLNGGNVPNRRPISFDSITHAVRVGGLGFHYVKSGERLPTLLLGNEYGVRLRGIAFQQTRLFS